MKRCTELCTKEATGSCELCEALAERDRFERLWFQKEVFRSGFHRLRQWWYPVLRQDWEVRPPEVVREAHKQYSETLNRIMLALLGVALFCLLTALGSPDKLLLAADSTIKVPLADAPMSFFGFIVVAPFLLIVLTLYLHIFYGCWLDGCATVNATGPTILFPSDARLAQGREALEQLGLRALHAPPQHRQRHQHRGRHVPRAHHTPVG